MKTAFHISSPLFPKAAFALVVALSVPGWCLAAAADLDQSATNLTVASAERIRQPAVAGLFYPKDPKELARDIDRYLAIAPSNKVAGVHAIICPHAGYEYSGPVAASAYRQVVGSAFDHVIILAPSHYALFEGVSVPATDAYSTPLGKVPVWNKARELAREPPFVLEPKCLVQRPRWAGTASKPVPPDGEETPETWEHSVEVQMPFLQRSLRQFEILPVVYGRVDPAEVAKRLASLVDEKTLVVASSDLSHFHPYKEARGFDQQTLKWICASDLSAFNKPEAEDRACGRMPIMTLMHLAKIKGWKPQLLDYRNSGDTAGNKGGVVGYGAVAFVGGVVETRPSQPAAKEESVAQLNSEERKFLLDLARKTLVRAASGEPLPDVKADTVPAACQAVKGCFVTLTKAGVLRGCIGNITPAAQLYYSVVENTCNAALRDPRFPPVTGKEVPALRIEISVLGAAEPLAFSSPDDLLAKLHPHRDGVVLRISGSSATFLPQVWEQLPDKTEFLRHLSAKAGCPPDAWRGNDVSVSIYHVEAFPE